MSKLNPTATLPTVIHRKLQSIRRRVVATSVGRGLAIATTSLIGAMIGAMLVDWAFVLFDPIVRVTLTVLAFVVATAAFIFKGMVPIVQARRLAHAARRVDQRLPQLQQRWMTVSGTPLQSGDRQSTMSKSMLDQVTSEAVAMQSLVRPSRIAPLSVMTRPMIGLALSLVALTAFLAIHPPITTTLLKRFWSPMSEITATILKSETGDATVPRGESVNLRVTQDGVLQDRAELTLEFAKGDRETLQLDAAEDQASEFLRKLRVDESTRYRLAAGDARTPWHRIDVIDYPVIDRLRLTVAAPQYANRPDVVQTHLPRRIKVLEGSMIQLEIRPREKIRQMTVALQPVEEDSNSDAEVTDELIELLGNEDGWYRFESSLVSDIILKPRLESVHGLTNQTDTFCRIEVITDKAPIARVVTPKEDLVIAVDDVIEIEFEAHDDFGIAAAELIVFDESKTDPDGNPMIVATEPIPLADMTAMKDVAGKATLDTKKLNVVAGTKLTYAIRVTDNRDAPRTGVSGTRQNSDLDRSGIRQNSDRERSGNRQNSDLERNGTRQNSDRERNGNRQNSNRERNGTRQNSNRERNGNRQNSDALEILADANAKPERPGQSTVSHRRTLKVTDRIAAIAASSDAKLAADDATEVRERVARIDTMLEQSEELLTKLVDHNIPDSQRGQQFGVLDRQMGEIEDYVSDLRIETRETSVAFIGLQMVDIARSQITPARDRAFNGIRNPNASDLDAKISLGHVARARELLAALLKRYEKVQQDRDLNKSLEDAVTIYEVYVEKSQKLMREARQNRNPLVRKMGVIEVDQEYLDRYAEVLSLRRDMIEEFGRLLGDDPRLLSRYMELVRRRRTSLRDQLSELSDRQTELTTELAGWIQIDDDQRGDYWTIIAELRLSTAERLANDGAEFADRVKKQLPLGIDIQRGAASVLVRLADEAAEKTRQVSLEANDVYEYVVGQDASRNDTSRLNETSRLNDSPPWLDTAKSLPSLFAGLDVSLDRLQAENENDDDFNAYLQSRMQESRAVADQADAWRVLAIAFHNGDYESIVEIEQYRLAVATETLRNEMDSIEGDLETQFQQQAETSVPAAIVQQVEQLKALVEMITFNQTAATFSSRTGDFPRVSRQQMLASQRFEQAAQLFDEMRRAVADALDAFDPRDPNIADLVDPTLDEFLARLEREPNIASQLGIPNRPRNLRVVADSMLWSESNANLLGASGEAAMMRAKEAMKKKTVGKPDRAMPSREGNQAEPTDEDRERLAKAEETQKMLEKALLAIQQRREDQETSDAQNLKLDETAKKLKLMLEQNETTAGAMATWEQMTQTDQANAILMALRRGEEIPDQQWNKLLSTLGDGLWQVKGKKPPEAYRKAIQEYQDQLRDLLETGDGT